MLSRVPYYRKIVKNIQKYVKMPCPATILMLSPSFSSFTAASQPVLARAFCNISGRSVGSKVEAWATNGFLGIPHIVSPKIILGLLLRCFPWPIFRVMMFFCMYISILYMMEQFCSYTIMICDALWKLFVGCILVSAYFDSCFYENGS